VVVVVLVEVVVLVDVLVVDVLVDVLVVELLVVELLVVVGSVVVVAGCVVAATMDDPVSVVSGPCDSAVALQPAASVVKIRSAITRRSATQRTVAPRPRRATASGESVPEGGHRRAVSVAGRAASRHTIACMESDRP